MPILVLLSKSEQFSGLPVGLLLDGLRANSNKQCSREYILLLYTVPFIWSYIVNY